MPGTRFGLTDEEFVHLRRTAPFSMLHDNSLIRMSSRYESSLESAVAADAGACGICLDTSPLPIPLGCACRGNGGRAHVACLVQSVASQACRGNLETWRQCPKCQQAFTGAMRTGLAEAWRSRVADQAAESAERVAAESNLAVCLLHQGKNAEAEPVLRELRELHIRVLGAQHPSTLMMAANLASSLSGQGKHADAERIERELLGVYKWSGRSMRPR